MFFYFGPSTANATEAARTQRVESRNNQPESKSNWVAYGNARPAVFFSDLFPAGHAGRPRRGTVTQRRRGQRHARGAASHRQKKRATFAGVRSDLATRGSRSNNRKLVQFQPAAFFDSWSNDLRRRGQRHATGTKAALSTRSCPGAQIGSACCGKPVQFRPAFRLASIFYTPQRCHVNGGTVRGVAGSFVRRLLDGITHRALDSIRGRFGVLIKPSRGRNRQPGEGPAVAHFPITNLKLIRAELVFNSPFRVACIVRRRCGETEGGPDCRCPSRPMGDVSVRTGVDPTSKNTRAIVSSMLAVAHFHSSPVASREAVKHGRGHIQRAPLLAHHLPLLPCAEGGCPARDLGTLSKQPSRCIRWFLTTRIQKHEASVRRRRGRRRGSEWQAALWDSAWTEKQPWPDRYAGWGNQHVAHFDIPNGEGRTTRNVEAPATAELGRPVLSDSDAAPGRNSRIGVGARSSKRQSRLPEAIAGSSPAGANSAFSFYRRRAGRQVVLDGCRLAVHNREESNVRAGGRPTFIYGGLPDTVIGSGPMHRMLQSRVVTDGRSTLAVHQCRVAGSIPAPRALFVVVCALGRGGDFLASPETEPSRRFFDQLDGGACVQKGTSGGVPLFFHLGEQNV